MMFIIMIMIFKPYGYDQDDQDDHDHHHYDHNDQYDDDHLQFGHLPLFSFVQLEEFSASALPHLVMIIMIAMIVIVTGRPWPWCG